jgi:hypothetical protein
MSIALINSELEKGNDLLKRDSFYKAEFGAA